MKLKDARHLWGKNTFETEIILKEELGNTEIRVLSIGQAGENMVKIAGVISDEEHAAARCGMGAVMGSKNLKAIAVRGSKTINIADPGRLFELVDGMYEDYKKCSAYDWYTKYGGTVAIIDMCRAGSAPIKNYLKSGGTDLNRRIPISHEKIFEKYKLKDVACYGCPLACDKWTYIDGLGRCKHPDGGSFHSAIWEIYDYPFIVEFNRLCDRYGLDLYSVQMVTAAAMEWYEKGVITKKDTDGMDHGPIDCSAIAGLTLSLSVSTRGAGHLRAVAPMAWGVSDSLPPKWQKVYKEAGAGDLVNKQWVCHPVKAEIATYFEHICTSTDILEICKNTTEFFFFYGYEGREKKDDLEWHAYFLKAVTGFDADRVGLEKITRRVLNIEKVYNVREGKRMEHDMPSSRFLQKRKGGPLNGKALDPKELEKLFKHYYKIHGWDPETSIPKRSTLEELGLKYAADELEEEYGIQL